VRCRRCGMVLIVLAEGGSHGACGRFICHRLGGAWSAGLTYALYSWDGAGGDVVVACGIGRHGRDFWLGRVMSCPC